MGEITQEALNIMLQDGKTKITVTPTLISGNSYKYKVAANPTTPEYNAVCTTSMSFEDISKLEEFIPEYKVTDKNKIGNTYVYICEKVQE